MRVNLKSENSSIPLIIPLIVAIGVLCLSFLASLTFGVADITWQDLLSAFTTFDGSTSHLIITTIRLPR